MEICKNPEIRKNPEKSQARVENDLARVMPANVHVHVHTPGANFRENC